MGRRCALLVLLALVSPAAARAERQQVIAARPALVDLAVDRDGGAFLVSASRSAVHLRSAAPGAVFAPGVTLRDRAVDVAVASDGRGAIVLQRDRRVRVVTFDRGKVAAPSVVSRGRTADFAASAVARGGAAVVVWFRHTRAGRWRLEAAVRDPGAAAFGAPQPLSRFVRRPCCTYVSVAIGDRGDAVAAWRSTSDPALWTSLRRPGESFRPAQRLAEDSSDDPKTAVGEDGTAAVLYSLQRVPVRAGDGLRLQRAGPGRPFGAPEVVNPGGGVTIGDTAITPAGRVLVAWVDHAEARVRVSESEPGAPLVEMGAIGAGVAPRAVALAAADDGRAVVAWSQQVRNESSYSEQTVAATRVTTAAGFGPAVALGSPWRVAEPRVARLVPGGGALVAWRGSDFRPRNTVLAVTRVP
jgi:hypothetical protein